MIKRKSFVPCEAACGTQASCLTHQSIAHKYEDPRSPTISVRIRDQVVDQCLLDTEASVNFLPYFVYKQLGLGELQPLTLHCF